MEEKKGRVETSTRPIEAVLKETRLRHVPRSDTVVVDLGTPAREVIRKMQESRSGGALVVDAGGRLAGIFTERDYLDKLALADMRARSGVDLDTPIERLMTPSPRALSTDATLGEAIRLMTEGGYRHIPLVEADGKVIGMVSANDAADHIAEHFPLEVFNLPPRLHQRIRTREGG